MPKYTVFDSVNLRAVHFGERIFDCVADEDIENGTFGYMDGLADGYDHVYKFAKGTKKGEAVVVANQPAWTEDTSRTGNQRRDKFVIPAGTPFRVFVLHEGDEFGISIEGITSDTRSVVTGESDFAKKPVYLTVDATGKLAAKTTATEDAAMEARIERKRMVGAKLVTDVREYGVENAMYEARIKVLA